MNAAPVIFELRGKRVFVAGHNGMVGSAIVRRLKSEACETLVVDRSECDLRRPDEVERYLARARPEAIFLAAGTVGGIHANSAFPADFIGDNLAIAQSVISAAHRGGVRKL